MRADRLLSILFLLQSRGKMTARALAEALEVTERTIYRDIDALCAAGVPVYPDHGPGGGYALLDSYRTSLTGLTEGELSALFMLGVPPALETLGVSQALRSALLKLMAALPSAPRAEGDPLHNRFLVDWESFQPGDPAPHLAALQEAVSQNRRVLLSYRMMLGAIIAGAPAEPYGLVAKAGEWFLVAMRAGRMDAIRAADLTEVVVTGETFTRLAGFDLAAFWKDWCEQYAKRRSRFWATLRFAPGILPLLPLFFGRRAREWTDPRRISPEDGWLAVTVDFPSLENARGVLLSMGRAVEVLDPPALRCSIIDYAQQIVAFYGV